MEGKACTVLSLLDWEWIGMEWVITITVPCILGWLEKREFPKINFRHVDPGVYVFGGLKKVVKKKLG